MLAKAAAKESGEEESLVRIFPKMATTLSMATTP